MNVIKPILSLIFATAFSMQSFAVTALTPKIIEENSVTEAIDVTFSFSERKELRKAKAQDVEPVIFHATLTQSGTLGSVIGDKIYDIDAIVVEGPMNDADFNTLWDSSFNGYLKVINLENAVIEGGKIPENALFHVDEQVDWETMAITTIWLEKIVLPDGITEIGKFAFAYATTLTEVNFPSSLRYIGCAAFTDCVRLESDQLKLTEGLEKIDEQAFYQCYSLTGAIELPRSLKWIDSGAFYRCRISDISFPEGLEYLGCMAFIGSRITKAILPDNCYLCPHGAQFYNNLELTEAHLPDNSLFVPQDIFSGCYKLNKVNIPSKALSIDEFAFNGTDIDQIDFPVTLESIGQDAFQGCGKLTEIILPPSLKSIGNRAFVCHNMQKIYCMATVPPTALPAMGYDGEENPFDEVNTLIPVYIPVGTTQLYQAATGWNHFTNFIETDDFPSTGVEATVIDHIQTDTPTYDLQGRKVQTTIPGSIYIKNGQKFLCK